MISRQLMPLLAWLRRHPGAGAGSWFVFLAAAITAAWWARPGYVWLLDSVWGPHAHIHWDLGDPTLAWQIITVTLSGAFSAPVAEKLILSLLLPAIGLGGYYLARRFMKPGWSLAAGTLFLLNPFVYERLLAGQWIVLAGYAFMPIVLALAWVALTSGGRRGAYRLAGAIAVYPLVSQHYAYISAWLLLVLAAVYVVRARPVALWFVSTLIWLAGTAVGALALNSFWLLAGRTAPYSSFDSGDFAMFQTAADPQFGVWVNILSLYGFWRGSAYLEPKIWLTWWWLVALVIALLSVVGIVRALRDRHILLLALALTVPFSLVLAVGYASSLSQPLTDWLMHHLPGFAGLRDTSKLVGPLALALAMLAPWGAAWLAERYLPRRRAIRFLAPAALCLVAALSVTGIWNGYSGQVVVADYPPGWYAAEQQLAANPNARALVLPWHGYISLDFANGTYTALPAPGFFRTATLVSDSLDSPLDPRPPSALDHSVLSLLNGTSSPQAWSADMKHRGLTHVILLKTDDWPGYAEALASLPLESDDPSIAVYRLP